jgi:N-acyl-D-amino-acid deacylase
LSLRGAMFSSMRIAPNSARAALRALLLVAGASCASAGRGSATSQPVFDVVIRGARIVDGTGDPWRYGDLAIRGDRIVLLGTVPAAATATRTN